MYKKLNMLKQLMQSNNNENFFIFTHYKEKADIAEAMAILEGKQVIRWNVSENDAYFNPLEGTEEELIHMLNCMLNLSEEEKFVLTMIIKIAKRTKDNICMNDILKILCNENDVGRTEYILPLKKMEGIPATIDRENYFLANWFLNDYYVGANNAKLSSTYQDLKYLRIKLMNFIMNSPVSKMMELNKTNENEIKVFQTSTNMVQIILLEDDAYLKKYNDFIIRVISKRLQVIGEQMPFTYVIGDGDFLSYPEQISDNYKEQILKVQKEMVKEKKPANIDINEEFGEKIRRKREGMGISREDMASVIDITPNFLGDVERGKKALSTQKMFAVCNMLNISLDGLIKNTNIEEMNKKMKAVKADGTKEHPAFFGSIGFNIEPVKIEENKK